MISKRTKVFAVLFVLCALFVFLAEYKDFRSYHELLESYKGRGFAAELLEPPAIPLLAQAAFFMAAISLVAAFSSVIVDIYNFWHRPKR
jgi:hypothetical protein